eukprot:CAMPEP_0185790976 /NCGR_PEP_ID=MMETSP1174-20130828/158105_1 /TAXON_ID=35687 /ORGANISM="Dictyocha speculum, Strain CCMP1381" /LENGTH=58 /DNA_ID=CAMNT_0028485851 /DNA_START=1495 /DNA_END=1671 /DNA_ORIENTATION=+
MAHISRKGSEELDVDTRHDCQDDICSFMMNEWRGIWLLRDGHQHVWKDGCCEWEGDWL